MNLREFALVAAVLPLLAVAAADLAPEALVRSVTDEVIAAIKRDARVRAGSQEAIVALVEKKVLPHFDFERMTALAMGPHWRAASAEQRQALVREFRTLLVRTYSGALSAYRDQAIEVLPLRARPGDTDVVVRSVVKQPGAEPVRIDYSMEKTDEGWKVYDISVGGMSLVMNYRGSFDNQVRSTGIDGLIKALAEKNRALEASRG